MADTHRRDRVAIALILLHDQLIPVIAEVLAGELSQEDERRLAGALRMIAADLDPVVDAGEQRSDGATASGSCSPWHWAPDRAKPSA